jgi:hypothetical protein
MQGYHAAMVDIADQLMEKWSRLNADEEIDIPGDMTRLTLDTIGLCGFDYRFNSFSRENSHPFVESMSRALGESMMRLQRLPLANKLLINKRRQFHTDIEYRNVSLLSAKRLCPPMPTRRQQHLCLHSEQQNTVQTTRRSDQTSDYGRSRHRIGTISWFLTRTCGLAEVK